MVKLDNVTEGVLDVINDNKFSQTGAFNPVSYTQLTLPTILRV